MVRILRIAGVLIALSAKTDFVAHQEVAGPEAAAREATPQEAQIGAIPGVGMKDSGHDRARLVQGIRDHGDIRIQGNASG